MQRFHPRLALAALATGVLLIAIYAITVLRFRDQLRSDIHQKIVERDAAVLYPVAQAQLRDAEADPGNQAFVSEMLLPAVLKTVQGMRAVTIYDADANILQSAPPSTAPVTLSADDFARLAAGQTISRYTAGLSGRPGASAAVADPRALQPMLAVLLPLHASNSGQTIGFVRYDIDGTPLAFELARIDDQLDRQSTQTLALGSALIALVLFGAYAGLSRAQRIIAERNERLTRANFELTLAAKTSALGVITSHLIHGLQGPVAGLRAMMAEHAAGTPNGTPEWESAATYMERMQAMIHETVALLGDTHTQTSYELTTAEVAATIRDRNQAAAVAKGVVLEVGEGEGTTIDSHRGSLVCLIATNLLQNSIEATDPGRHVRVAVRVTPASVQFDVQDEGRGIPPSLQAHLFEPGRTGRIGGSGLGLAISQLIARQIGASLELVTTGAAGTTFRLTVPRSPDAPKS